MSSFVGPHCGGAAQQSKRRIDFLWSDDWLGLQSGSDFRVDGFGKYILNRTGVINEVMKAVDSQLLRHPSNSTGVYLSGCRGMGKTCDLKLLANYLKSVGWEVHWFASAADIPQGIGSEFLSYALGNKLKKIAVIIDQVTAQPEDGLFIALLKDAPPNILTIGAAIPRYLQTGSIARFRTVLCTSSLVLKEGDEDVVELIRHWKAIAKDISPDMVEYVSKFLLSHCGGHVYPVLAFMEHFFTNDAAKKFLIEDYVFHKYFSGPEFANSPVYQEVCARCFQEIYDHPLSIEALSRVLSGRGNATDVHTLTHMGWWDPDKHDVISAVFLNEYLARGVSLLPPDESMYLVASDSPEDNIEKLIIGGLSRMEPHDFITTSGNWPIENALSHNWACSVKSLFGNVHLKFQHPINGSWIDFALNGFVNGYVEVLRNARRTEREGVKPGSQDINEHLERFLTGAYRGKKHFALLNFAIEGKIVLPNDTEYHKNVYTYNYVTNSLYRGEELIRFPAVAKRSCPPVGIIRGGGKGIKGINGTKGANYSTVAKGLVPHTLSAYNFLKVLKKL